MRYDEIVGPAYATGAGRVSGRGAGGLGMRNRGTGLCVWGRAAVAAAVALGAVGAAWAQPGPAGGGANAPAANAKAGRNNAKARPPARGGAAAKNAGGGAGAGDPLAARGKGPDAAKPGSYHFRLKIHAIDDAPLAASYYPANRADTNAPVVLLVHERDRSGKDFEDPVTELKGKGLAEHLQGLGYAVLSPDLRGYGANARRAMSERDWFEMVDDLGAFYQFLVDRHNRGELNLAKLGVVALGEGANLTAAWAASKSGAVSSEGRVTDLSGLVLLSPQPEGGGLAFAPLATALAPRIPVLLMAGERDAPAHDTLKRVRAAVEKTRQNRVEVFPSSLRGFKLLRLEPRATAVIDRFLDSTVKLKTSDWEPRYNLSPVSYEDIQVVKHASAAESEKADRAKAKGDAPKAKDDPADAPKAKDDAPKAKEAAKPGP